MTRFLIASSLLLAVIGFSGCTVKTANAKAPKAQIVLPECVPGPLGDCPRPASK